MRIKVSTVLARAAEVVTRPYVDDIAYHGALSLAASNRAATDAAESFAAPYVAAEPDPKDIPQRMSRAERSLLFCFLAEVAKSEGK